MEGWGCFVFKEKLKCLREDLKRWNRDQFGNLDDQISSLREEIQRLDIKDDNSGLLEEEISRRREATAHLILYKNNRRSLPAQKARLRCLREGDVNSRTFHKEINHRRNTNGLMGLEIKGDWMEEPGKVKGEVRDHFKKIFSRQDPSIIEMPEDLFESRLDEADGDSLTRIFTEDEIKLAIWDCESSKCPRP